ncbi:MBL fold metallo-hydrolase [Vitiosangium sp. GDMCC 1.1324]|uniref:MBL fold metallo-hydrolase n=1 Tax=Vitiosangium sp. (strain GDMCC 1.1324) TaxID=2138576 RepID=UPI000D3A8A46|nr:MBL fold metallo-hydrolase [Vitiosangium sp. GDMCC 1.1324]PTL85268.1 MBL fold hydrolase [Vitiosangium sp. GDMCC 1.1324]
MAENEQAGTTAEASVPFHVRFWGVRGSIPVPGPKTQRYGGNTPCVEVRCGDELLIFDLGTGVRVLGEELLAGRGPTRATIFLSHYHYDHLQGLPFFTPIMIPKFAFTVYGAPRDGRSVKEVLAGQMVQPYFPVTAEQVFKAQLTYKDLEAGQQLELGPARIRTLDLNHPGGNLGYRVECNGKSVVYATDVEHGCEKDRDLVEFARDADVLIIDAMYTEDEYRGRKGAAKIGWGHSTWESAVETANASKVKKLVLFHHETTRDDDAMDQFVERVRKHRPDAIAAVESEILKV